LDAFFQCVLANLFENVAKPVSLIPCQAKIGAQEPVAVATLSADCVVVIKLTA
jgi:hypothetical protein